MKILWNSSVPFGNSGYGTISREIVRRLTAEGHKVAIPTKHAFWGRVEWEGIEVFEGINSRYIGNIIKRDGYDYIISMWDIWLMSEKRHYPHDKWIAYCPIDTEWIAKRYSDVLLGMDSQMPENKGPGVVIAMSKHGSRELQSIGLDPLYAPVGVRTDIFKPDKEARATYRKNFKWPDDVFVVGSVGLNYKDDRKGFIDLMVAFKELTKRHSDVRLYLHTHAEGARENTLNYTVVLNNLELYNYVLFGPQEAIDQGTIGQEQLSKLYNTFDVFCLPTKGEGFGLPIVEAASCGIPVATTATTTGPEFHKAGVVTWLIDIDWLTNGSWMPTNTWRYEPNASQILKQLEAAYNFWKFGDYTSLKHDVRKAALQYDWNKVWPKHWQPILKTLEQNKGKNK